MLEREKVGCRWCFRLTYPKASGLSHPPPIGQMGYQSCNSSDDDVPRDPSSKASKQVGEQTLYIKEALKQNQNSLFQLNRSGWAPNLVKLKPHPPLDLELILMHNLDPWDVDDSAE